MFKQDREKVENDMFLRPLRNLVNQKDAVEEDMIGNYDGGGKIRYYLTPGSQSFWTYIAILQ